MNTSLSVDDISAYLVATGWEKIGNLRGIASIWRRSLNDKVQEIVAPTENAADFQIRYAELIKKIQNYENVSLDEITTSILQWTHDHLSIKVQHTDVSDGTIPIDDGIEMAKSARELIISAARSSIQPRRTHRGHPPSMVSHLISQTRLGQTSRGSFILNIFTKVSPSNSDANAISSVALPGTLLSSLSSISKLIDSEILSPSLEKAVLQGASSNMCDAIIKLFGEKRKRDVTITFRASSKDRVVPMESFKKTFKSSDAEKLELASRYLKESYELRNIKIFGYVKRLDRDHTEQQGAVWIHTTLPTGQDKNIKVYLSQEHYQIAIHAHRSKQVIWCDGDVIVKPRSAILVNQRSFGVVVQGDMLNN